MALRVRVSLGGRTPRLQAAVSPQLSKLLTLTAKSGEGEDGSFPKNCSAFPRGRSWTCVWGGRRATQGAGGGVGVPGLRSVGRSRRLAVTGTGVYSRCHSEPARSCRAEGRGASRGEERTSPDDTIGTQGKLVNSQ